MTEALVGIPLPREVRDTLAKAQGGLAVGAHLHPDDFILLLAELGDQPEATLDAVRSGLEAVSCDVFRVAVEGLDSLGGAAPDAVCASVPMTDGLKELHRQVGRAVREAGVPLAYQKYTPGIVLARFGQMGQHDLKQIMSFLSRRSGLKAGPWPVTEFALWTARAGGDGPALEKLEGYPLSGRLIRA